MRKLPAVVVLLSVLVLPLPAVSQDLQCGIVNPLPDPYVFILFDISGSMNHAAGCTQAEYNAGQCGYVCSGSQCHTPLQGDHPGSKWFQARQALYNVVSGIDDVRLGFATFSNQDGLRVNSKHWLYQATTDGPVIPSFGAYPAVGSQEVFGRTWSCNTGSGGTDGCSVSVPADTNDAWEITRVQRLPKGGDAFNQTVDVFVRKTGYVYRVRYQPVAGGTLGGSIQTTITTVRCLDSTCTNNTPVGTSTVSWEPVSDFLSWEAGSSASRSHPYTFFNQGVSLDSFATPVACSASGSWEANTDELPDATIGGGFSYNLKQPTDASDPRGTPFTFGDVIPLDWLDRHQEDVLARLAPNLTVDPLAVPDFRTAAYFQDLALPGETFLRLKDETARPLVPLGLTSLAWSIRSFYCWFNGTSNKCQNGDGWDDVAYNLDPDWGCRRLHLLIITDSQEDCTTMNPCADIADLYARAGMKTSVIGIGQTPINPLHCMALNGRGQETYPKTRQQLEQSLTDFFDWVRQYP